MNVVYVALARHVSEPDVYRMAVGTTEAAARDALVAAMRTMHEDWCAETEEKDQVLFSDWLASWTFDPVEEYEVKQPKPVTVRELIQEYLGSKAVILFTREVTDGYLALYATREDTAFTQKDYIAFFTTGMTQQGRAVRREWVKPCTPE